MAPCTRCELRLKQMSRACFCPFRLALHVDEGSLALCAHIQKHTRTSMSITTPHLLSPCLVPTLSLLHTYNPSLLCTCGNSLSRTSAQASGAQHEENVCIRRTLRLHIRCRAPRAHRRLRLIASGLRRSMQLELRAAMRSVRVHLFPRQHQHPVQDGLLP